MKQKELVLKVCEWADNKGITEHGTIPKQLLKTHEELHELYLALEDFKASEIIDAVGDVFVTLIIARYLEVKNKDKVVSELGDYSVPNNNTFALSRPERIVQITLPYWIDLFDIYKKDGELRLSNIKSILWNLNRVALSFGTTIDNCLFYAYNVIKDRTGKMQDGEFNKDK